MVQAVLTQKTANYLDYTEINTPPSEYTTTSSSYAQVTGWSFTGTIPDKTWAKVGANIYGGNSSGTLNTWQLRDSTGVTVYGTMTRSSQSYGIQYFDSFYNNTGSDLTNLTLWAKAAINSTLLKTKTPATYYYASYNQNGDITGVKYMINNIYLLGGTTFGITGSPTAVADIELKSICSDIVFTSNSKENLWDWAGYYVGVEP